ncbi:MAG: phytanoyl-CoA dioxygenase family protein [Alphaproteobacteria bacterium]
MADTAARLRADPATAGVRWYRGFQEFICSNPSFAGIAKMLGGRDALALNPTDLFRLHHRAITTLHQGLNDGLLAAFAKLVEVYVGTAFPGVSAEPTQAGGTKDIGQSLEDMRHQGFTRLPTVDAERVTAFQHWFNEGGYIPAEDVRKPMGSVETRSAEILRHSLNLAYVPRDRVLQAPGLLDIATDLSVLKLVRAYLGAPPVLIDISAWRSFAGEGGAKDARDAQLLHYDLDDYRFVKFFVYLTDVDECSGPHVFFPRTHRLETIANSMPDGGPEREAFQQWYFGTLRKSDEEARDRLGIEPVSLTGSPGTCLLVDTSGLHRGEPPSTRDRIVLQFVYGITPFAGWDDPFEIDGPRGLSGGPAPRLTGERAYAAHVICPWTA